MTSSDAAVVATEKRIRALERDISALQQPMSDDDDASTLEHGGVAARLYPAVNMDPFAFLCRCKYRRIGQSYVLHERRVLTSSGAVKTSLILVGPHWIGVVVTLGIILGATGAFIRDQCLRLSWHYTLAALCMCSVTLYYLFETACRDPGIVQSRFHSTSSFHGDSDDSEVATTPDDASTENTGALDSDDVQLLVVPRSRTGSSTTVTATTTEPTEPTGTTGPQRRHRRRICDVCDVEQTALTEHCDDCDVCVVEFDHHCPWMGKCIGQRNMRAFKRFNVAWVLYAMFAIGVSLQNVDWSIDTSIVRLERVANGSWVPVGSSSYRPHA